MNAAVYLFLTSSVIGWLLWLRERGCRIRAAAALRECRTGCSELAQGIARSTKEVCDLRRKVAALQPIPRRALLVVPQGECETVRALKSFVPEPQPED